MGGFDQIGGAGAAFLASFVECVEALTVVLALGAARGWRSPLAGVAASLGVLALVIGLFGRALASLNTPALRLVIGVLVLLFGLRWLRKAILRAGGRLPLHDEAATYAKTTARYAPHARSAGWDGVAFAGAFQISLLEGMEVAFIVIALGSGHTGLLPPAIGAAGALAAVAGLGLALHRPLSRIPENTLKFTTAILLTAFGTVWTGEGIGAAWPGGDAGPLVVAVAWAVLSLCLVRLVQARAS